MKPDQSQRELVYSKSGAVLDLQYLHTFVMVVATGSFTLAAAKLGYRQSSVTHHIKMLEYTFGTALLHRSRFTKAVMTEAGRQVYEYAERLLTLAEQTVAAVRRV